MKHLAKTVSALLLIAPLGLNAYAAENQTQNMPSMKHEQGGMQGMMNMDHGKGGMSDMMNMDHGQGGMQGMNKQQGQGGMQGMGGMGMMGNMSDEQMDQHLRMMQEHMLQMHDLSDKILAASDPAQKEKLKKQQLDLMKAHKKQMMQMMHGAMGQGGAAMGQKQAPAAQQDIQHQKHPGM